jgi:hypothetical protein
MQCKFIKPNKEQCKANSLTNSQFCFRHDPKHATEAHRASQKGGENRNHTGGFDEKISLKKPQDIQDFLSKVINYTWQGKIPAKDSSSMGFLTRCWLDAYDKAELEQRVNELEKQLLNNN